ncbi:hypothetical protein CAJAP_04035 [Camponotus japonicus]
MKDNIGRRCYTKVICGFVRVLGGDLRIGLEVSKKQLLNQLIFTMLDICIFLEHCVFLGSNFVKFIEYVSRINE